MDSCRESRPGENSTLDSVWKITPEQPVDGAGALEAVPVVPLSPGEWRPLAASIRVVPRTMTRPLLRASFFGVWEIALGSPRRESC